jgi:hypothetical protein
VKRSTTGWVACDMVRHRVTSYIRVVCDIEKEPQFWDGQVSNAYRRGRRGRCTWLQLAGGLHESDRGGSVTVLHGCIVFRVSGPLVRRYAVFTYKHFLQLAVYVEKFSSIVHYDERDSRNNER